MTVRLFLGTCLLLAVVGSPLPATDNHWQMIVQWDNDLLTGTDDGYTNGARVAFARELPADSEEHNFLQSLLGSLTGAERGGELNELRFPDSTVRRFQYGFGLTQLMFTPEDPNLPAPLPGERPYAGWLGLEFSLQASGDDSASTATISIGTTGELAHGHDTQDWVHENISDSPLFQGWNTEAPGEPTLNLHLEHKQRLDFLKGSLDWPIEFDGFYEWGGALGNFRTNGYAGLFLRVGQNLPKSYATPRVQLGSFTETSFNQIGPADASLAINAFAGLRGYAVLHDISLDGPLFRDWAEAVESEPWVGEFSFGFATHYRGLELSLSHTIRSDEFKGQKNRSRFGSVLARVSVEF